MTSTFVVDLGPDTSESRQCCTQYKGSILLQPFLQSFWNTLYCKIYIYPQNCFYSTVQNRKLGNTPIVLLLAPGLCSAALQSACNTHHFLRQRAVTPLLSLWWRHRIYLVASLLSWQLCTLMPVLTISFLTFSSLDVMELSCLYSVLFSIPWLWPKPVGFERG